MSSVGNLKLTTLSIGDQGVKALFSPERGMNLLSLQNRGIEAIDQSTFPLFEERWAGLGALIGPHFHHRKRVPQLKDEALFPHFAPLKAKGVKEPFSHGIGRYAPWDVTFQTKKALHATLSSKKIWRGSTLEELEGKEFEMGYEATIIEEGVQIKLSVSSNLPSVVGLHTYYNISSNHSRVESCVKEEYNEGGALKKIPKEWQDEKGLLDFDLKNRADFAFFPQDAKRPTITLKTKTHAIEVAYEPSSKEHCFQLWHPENVSFACIEPLSATEPREPILLKSSLTITIRILPC